MNEKTVEISESKFRINIKQNAKGEWYGDIKVRDDSLVEIVRLAKELKEKVEELCKEKSE